MTDYPMCHVCYYTADQCMCSLNLKPENTMEDNVTPIRPKVVPAQEQVHIDLRFDPGYPLDTMLAKAAAAGLKGAVIIGYNQDNSIYTDTNLQDGPLALFAVEVAKAKLMKGALE